MAINGVIIGLLIYLCFKICGIGFNQLFFKDKWLINAFLGCTLYFAIIQCSVYLTNLLKIPNNILAIMYLVILFGIVICALFKSWKDIFKLNNLFVVFIVCILTSLFMVRASNYSIGSTSDSVFYMSMVNENAFTTHWSAFSYYRGAPLQRFNPYYDYQSYYHLFAYIEKLYAQFFYEISYVPIYIWSALSCYVALLLDSILELGIKVYQKNKLIALLGWMFILVFNSASWHLLYGYFGHSWRVGILSIMLYSIYRYFKNNDNKWMLLMALSSNALIAVMSSALFVNGFIIATVIIILIAIKNKPHVFELLLVLPTYIYLAFLILDSYYITYKALVLFGILFLVLSFIYWFYYRIPLKIRKQISIGSVIFLFAIMCIIGNIQDTQFDMTYFFGNYVNELSVPYFGFSNLSLIITNLLWIVGALSVYIHYYHKINKPFKYFLIVSSILFINPCVISFITQYLTQMVYYRYLEIILNYYTSFVFAYGWYLIIRKIDSKMVHTVSLLVLSCILIYPLWINYNNNPFYYDLVEPIDSVYRIPTSELEADLALADRANQSQQRLNTVAQSKYTKAVAKNINLLYGVNYTRSFCMMCNANGMPTSAPSEMHNYFMMREFADQPIYQEAVNWDNACNAQYESLTELLLIDKTQTKLKDGVYVQIWLDMRACNDVIFENDDYVVLEFR